MYEIMQPVQRPDFMHSLDPFLAFSKKIKEKDCSLAYAEHVISAERANAEYFMIKPFKDGFFNLEV